MILEWRLALLFDLNKTLAAISYHLNALYLKVGLSICQSTSRGEPVGVRRRAVFKAAAADVRGDVKVD